MSDQDDTLTRMLLADPAPEANEDELAALWSMVEQGMTTDTATSHRQPERLPTAPRRIRPAIVIAVALVATLAVFLPLALLRGGVQETPNEPIATNSVPPATTTTTVPTTTTATPTATTAPSTGAPTTTVPLALTTDPLALQWRRVEMPGLSGAYQWFDSVVAGGPGLIAVGSPNGLENEFIWTSADGSEWSPANDEGIAGYGYAFDVAAGGPGYVAVGSSIWTSTDGITWTEAARQGPIVGELRAVTAGGPGLVAVGRFRGDLASIHTSSDGLSWSPIPQEGAPEAQIDSEITDIVAGGPGLVAVGNYGLIGAIWTSPDGFEWTRVPRDRAVFGNGSEGTELLSVAAGDSGLVAVGRITDDGTMGVWRSTDGLTWSVVPLDPEVLNESHELTAIISTDAGFIAGGAGEDNDAAVWYSPDGIEWIRLDTGDALGGPGHQIVNDVTVLGDRIVAIGVEFVDGVDTEVVWIGEPVEE